jgi:quinoprotein glucose dehydrogenase
MAWFLVLMVAAWSAASPVSAQTGARNGEWPHWGGDAGATRFAPLDRLTAGNVDSLRVAWRWSARNFGPTPEAYYRATPIMVGGVLYTTAGTRRAVVAIDAARGETLWTWRMDEGRRGEAGPRVNSGRGVAYAVGANGQPRIYVVTPGFQLVALDARTGRQIETFGVGGVVDLRESLERWSGRPVDRVEADIGSSSPPVIAGGVVVVGAAHDAGLRPPSRNNVPGYVQAFDAESGAPRWVFRTIPRAGEFGYETWEAGSADYSGNAGVWPPFTVDEQLGLVYLPTEAATADYYGGHRLGDNLFSTSLVAVRLGTGERVWHQQIIRHDVWDWDNPAAPILVDLNVSGRPVKAVVQLTKQSFAYVFDRENGRPVWPFVEIPVPASDVPGERLATHQAVPTKPPAYDRQGFSRDDLVDFTPEIRARAEAAIANLRLGGLFAYASLQNAPDGTQGTLTLPGTEGGGNWPGGVVDPETGVLYVASQTEPAALALTPGRAGSDMSYVLGRLAAPRVDGIPIVKPPWGRITAIDLTRGELLWQVANADTPPQIRDHPLLAGVDLPRTGWNTVAGLLVTRNLLFAGEGNGGTEAFRAHDKRTGEILWEMDLPATQTGMPMAYELAGRPYIVVAVGRGGTPGELVALTLP